MELDIIKLIRSTFGRYESNSGGCLKFHLLLKLIFPEAIGYYNEDHTITLINGVFYDIDGVYPKKKAKNFVPITDVGYDRLLNSFKNILSKTDIKLFNIIYY